MTTNNQNQPDDIGNPRDIGAFYMNRPQPAMPPAERKRFSPGMAAVAILSFFAGVVWYAYPRGHDRFADMDVPVIRADSAPYKAQPTEPGDMDVPHQDSTVFAPLENGTTAPAAAEKTAPQAEEPMPREEEISPSDDNTNVEQRDAQAAPAAAAPEMVATPAPATPEVLAAAPPVEEEKTATPIAPATDEKKPAPAPKKETAQAPVKKASTPAKAAAAVAPASGGKMAFVQLGSFKDEAAANKAWSQFKKQYGGVLGSLAPRIEKADLGAKGVFWRLQAGAVSENEGGRICKELKAKGFAACILAKR